jgi:hypothetical protein
MPAKRFVPYERTAHCDSAALALDPDGLLRAFAALIVACVVAALPRRWRVAGTAALVVALVFFALR